ncbi:MAG TPA: cytochrome P450, partial [Albitalea sp.]|nr:cytochrome P450 [Albitalea sp.]
AFDFAPTPRHPSTYDDADGRRCPIGAHIRRMNPRSAQVAGKPYSRRILRRGMAYGPAYDMTAEPPADAGTERGLVGLFICGDLENQFEFLMQFWANGDLSARGIRGMQDPLLGSQKMGGRYAFHLPGADEPVEITVPRLVTTRGSVYLFMPGIGGLRHLAGLSPSQGGKKTVPNTFDASRFDPQDPAFLADPYPTYAQFRRHRPVHFVGGPHQSHWVFSHQLVSEVLDKDDLFLKNRNPPLADGGMGDVLNNLENGLFFMDPPRHTTVRKMLDPLFDTAIQGSTTTVDRLASQIIAMLQQRPAVELIGDYALPLTAQVFMSVFGIELNHAMGIVGWVNAALEANNKALTPLQKAPGFTARMALAAYFQAQRPGCPMGQPNMLSQMHTHAEKPLRPDGLSPVEFQQTAVHFALGGFLSTEFLLATGVLNLLQHPAELARLRSTPALLQQAVEEMLRYDAPFQLTDRYVARSTLLGGHPLQAGDKVTMVFGSANRDEKVFDHPERFDITRVPSADPSKRHFSLGRGRHHCIGAPLVDIVAPIAIWKLVDALQGLRIDPAQPVEWRQDPYFRSPAKFPLLTR